MIIFLLLEYMCVYICIAIFVCVYRYDLTETWSSIWNCISPKIGCCMISITKSIEGWISCLSSCESLKRLFNFSNPWFMFHMIKWGNAFQGLAQCLVYSFYSINIEDESIWYSIHPHSSSSFISHQHSPTTHAPVLLYEQDYSRMKYEVAT